MTRIDTPDELENAANRIAHISRADLQIMLRRAALRLCNTEGIVLDQDVDEAVNALAAELNMTRQDLMRVMMREWLETGGYLPVRALEEDGDVDGNA